MRTIKMYEVNAKNFKKGGGLKKSAQTEWSMTLGDTEANAFENEETGIAKSIARGRTIESVESPYVFTHIRLIADGKQYVIYEDVLVAGHYLMTSPTKLLEALKAL